MAPARNDQVEEEEEEEDETRSFFNKLFSSCADDPKGSVHRAWGVSLLFLVLYFVLSVIEMLNLNHKGGSRALVLGSIWTGLVHVLLAVLGTFVLKRFPTSFAVGFLLGVLIVLANQNFILFGVFHGYSFGNTQTNHIFSSLCFTLSMVLLFFSVLVLHFRNDLVLAPVDVGQVKEGTEEAAFDYRQQERV